MALANVATADEFGRGHALPGVYSNNPQAHSSAVSWGAIMAGAAAAALSLILLILGTGLGLSSVSPWSHDGISATTFGVSTIVWLALTQLLASGMGGYLAGRLRTKWVETHTDEVYFRDTAHGFLAWAIAIACDRRAADIGNRVDHQRWNSGGRLCGWRRRHSGCGGRRGGGRVRDGKA